MLAMPGVNPVDPRRHSMLSFLSLYYIYNIVNSQIQSITNSQSTGRKGPQDRNNRRTHNWEPGNKQGTWDGIQTPHTPRYHELLLGLIKGPCLVDPLFIVG